MYQTFNQNQYMLQSELLRHGELAWLARNTYFGDQRNYLETHIDDNFLADDAWSVAGNATTAAHSTDFNPADALREVPADVSPRPRTGRRPTTSGSTCCSTAAAASRCADGMHRGGAGDAGTRRHRAPAAPAYGAGHRSAAGAFQATDPATGKPYTSDFGWISHTWDHPNIDEGCATQNYIEAELNQNTAGERHAAAGGNPISGGLGLTESTDPTRRARHREPERDHHRRALRPGQPAPGQPRSGRSADLDDATAATTGGTLAAGSYVYAVSRPVQHRGARARRRSPGPASRPPRSPRR